MQSYGMRLKKNGEEKAFESLAALRAWLK